MDTLISTMTRRILVVDDSPDVHEDFRKVLCPRGASAASADGLDELERELFGGSPERSDCPTFAVDSAHQGRAALELVAGARAAGQPYSMAFVDVRMPPGWDGLETIRRLWEVDPGLEIVICTAYSDHSWQQIFAVTGQTDQLLILKKPFQVDEARQLALALCTKRELKDAARLRREELERLVQARTAELACRNRELEHEIQERRAALQRLARSNRVRVRHARTLAILLRLSQQLSAADDVDAMIGPVVEAAARLTRSRRVSVMLPDRDGQNLRIAGAVGIDAQVRESVRVPVGSGIAGRVFQECVALIANEEQDMESTPYRLNGGYDDALFASIPLVSRALVSSGRSIGVLNLTNHDRGRPYSPRELRTLDTICNMAASAIGDMLARRARDEARDSIVTALATLVESRDDDTAHHLDRVTGYSLILAGALRASPFCLREIDAAFLQNLRRAVPLHDIGKVGIPDEILHKPGRLTEPEMVVMRRHTEIGQQTISAMRQRAPGTPFLEMADEIAIAHHERFDGGGYPHGLAGQSIPLAARIAAVADVYDALTTSRPYKDAFPHERAVSMILAESGRHFDPAVVEAFRLQADRFKELADRLADHPGPSEASNTRLTGQVIDEVLARV